MRTALSWRWRNVPVPEAHLAVLAAGLALGTVRRRPISSAPGVRRLGWLIITAGIGLAGRATRAAAEVDLEQPSRLVGAGPYARSRHPMYVAWTLIYLGVAFLLNTAWPVRLLPLRAALIHREARHEEERLAQTFGQEYVDYQGRVRPYL